MQKYFENELMITRIAEKRAPRSSAGKRIVEAVIDLVGDEADALAFGRRASGSASASRVIMVPVGLAGLADQHALRAASRDGRRSSASPVIAWRVSLEVSISTGSQPSAVRMWRYGG